MKRALVGLLMIAALAGGGALLMDAAIDPMEDIRTTEVEPRAQLAGVRSWGYQLQHLVVEKAAAGVHDLIVVDETLDGGRSAERKARSIARLKRKPDGGSRLVMAYLSIGEAEDYRSYWQPSWVSPSIPTAPAAGALSAIAAAHAKPHVNPSAEAPDRPLLEPTAAAPPWLGQENADWRGNFAVRFWEPGWQRVVHGGADAALDRVIAAGFDGVYLDRADVFAQWQRERPTARADMIEFIAKLSAYARQRKPGFAVIMQNAEELLEDERLRKSLDAVAKEDLLFGVDGEGRANSATDVAASIHYLKLARAHGMPVLVVEYLADAAAVDVARQRLAAEGFVAHFAPRLLNSLDRNP